MRTMRGRMNITPPMLMPSSKTFEIVSGNYAEQNAQNSTNHHRFAEYAKLFLYGFRIDMNTIEAGDMVDDFVDQQTDRKEHHRRERRQRDPFRAKVFCTSGADQSASLSTTTAAIAAASKPKNRLPVL